MYSIQELKSEIQSKVAWLESNNGPVLHKGWLCNAVMSDHQSVAGDDADFALCCMRHTVTAYVESYFRGIKTREEEGVEQELLPGFERLQKRYIVDRNEEQVIVSVHDITDEVLFKSQTASHDGRRTLRAR